MVRKLKGKAMAGKGLKGALARQLHKEGEAKRREHKQARLAAEKDAKRAKAALKQVHSSQKPSYPWKYEDKLLLVGEGDFLFALSIVKENFIYPATVVATSYDLAEEIEAKYPDGAANIAQLRELGVRVEHEVDATRLEETLHTKKKLLDVNTVLFNFPHTGKGVKDMDRNVRDHQILMAGFFKSARSLLSQKNDNDYFGNDWQIMVSMFDGEPYALWKVKALAREQNLVVERLTKFSWELYTGYHHRRTNSTRDTTKPAAERPARTYVFVDRPPKEEDEEEE